jgi:hypothetical protein
MPPISNVFPLNRAWRFALQGFDASCRLSVLYRMIGRYGAKLSALEHRADPMYDDVPWLSHISEGPCSLHIVR